ncbi:hypothetical protein [Planobispora longispora]|uniref:hypothetical protein n=1 Tax=Planobispora longispora TaxID=28887 RepID=UPI001942D4E2|nr:hypothetical protein [Planobispora longispora]
MPRSACPARNPPSATGWKNSAAARGRQPSATRSMPVSAQRSTPVGIAPIGVSMTGIV